jgi:hypothetical protein
MLMLRDIEHDVPTACQQCRFWSDSYFEYAYEEADCQCKEVVPTLSKDEDRRRRRRTPQESVHASTRCVGKRPISHPHKYRPDKYPAYTIAVR